MTTSVTVGAQPAPDTFKPNAVTAASHVTATGETSSSTHVGRDVPKVPVDPPAAVNGQIATAHGPASVHVDIHGRDIVTVGGVQMTMKEAASSGILTSQDAPEKAAKVEPKDLQATDAPEPQITAEDWADHAHDINAAGDAFTAAGIDEMEGITRAVQGYADGQIDADIDDALYAAFGDNAQSAVDAAYETVQGIAYDAVHAAGINTNDAELMARMSSALDNNLPVVVETLIGKPAKLVALINSFGPTR